MFEQGSLCIYQFLAFRLKQSNLLIIDIRYFYHRVSLLDLELIWTTLKDTFNECCDKKEKSRLFLLTHGTNINMNMNMRDVLPVTIEYAYHMFWNRCEIFYPILKFCALFSNFVPSFCKFFVILYPVLKSLWNFCNYIPCFEILWIFVPDFEIL